MQDELDDVCNHELFMDPSGDDDLMMNGRQHLRISFRGRITYSPTVLVTESRDVKFWLVDTEETRNSNVLTPVWCEVYVERKMGEYYLWRTSEQ